MARMNTPVRSDLIVRRETLPEVFAPGGVAEIAHFLAVTRSQVTTWINRRSDNGCPPRLWGARMGDTYDLLEWARWRKGEKFDPASHREIAVPAE
jgi:hypothetical protein